MKDDNENNNNITNNDINTENTLKIIPNEISTLFKSSKWEERKTAFTKLYTFLSTNPQLIQPNIRDIYTYIKTQLKQFKETNMNLIKEAINIFEYMLQSIPQTQKNSFNDIINELTINFYDKIGDSKLTEPTSKLFTLIITTFNSFTFFENIFKLLQTEKKLPILNGYLLFIENYIKSKETYEPISKKNLINFSIMLLTNPKEQLRKSAITFMGLLYKHIGSQLRKTLTNSEIKASTMKLIENIFNEIDKENLNEYLPEINDNDNEAQINKENNFNYKDVITIINKTKCNWNEKKDALDKLTQKINESNINTIPLDLIFVLIKDKLKDKQQKLVIIITNILNILINKLNKNIKNYCSYILDNLLHNLNNQNEQIRKESSTCINLIISFIGIDIIIHNLSKGLESDKYELKMEILSILNTNKNKLNKSYYSCLITPLLQCIQDKSPIIRKMTEDIIKQSLNEIDEDKYYENLSMFNEVPAAKIQKSLDNIFGKNDNSHNNSYDNSYMTITTPKRGYSIDHIKYSCYKGNKNGNLTPRRRYEHNLDSDRSFNSYNNTNGNEIQLSIHKTKTKTKNVKNDYNKLYSNDIIPNLSPPKIKKVFHAITPDRNIVKKKESLNSINNHQINNIIPIKKENEIFKIYKHGIDFYEKKQKRNERDLKLKISYTILYDDAQIETIPSKYLSLFLKDDFIKSTISIYTIFTEIIKILIMLIKKNTNSTTTASPSNKSENNFNSFTNLFYPNYDLVLKFLIVNISSTDQPTSVYQSLILFFNVFYDQLILNDLTLDTFEEMLTLQFLLEIMYTISNEKIKKLNTSIINLIKKYSSLISKELSYEIMLKYSIEVNNVFIKEQILNLFIDDISIGNINLESHTTNLQLFAKMLYSPEDSIKNKVNLIFKMFQSFLSDEMFNTLIKKTLNKQERNIVMLLLNKNNSCESNKSLLYCNKSNCESTPEIKLVPRIKKSTKSSKNKKHNDIISTINNSNNNDNENTNFRTISDSSNSSFNNRNSDKKENQIIPLKTSSSKTFTSTSEKINTMLNSIHQYESITDKDKILNSIIDILNSNNFIKKKKKTIKQITPLIIDFILTDIPKYFFNNNNTTYIKTILTLLTFITKQELIINTISLDNINKILLMLFMFLQQEKTNTKIDKSLFKTLNYIVLYILNGYNKTELILLLFDIADTYVKTNNNVSEMAGNCIINIIKEFKNYNNVETVVDVKVILNKLNEIVNRKEANDNEYSNIIKVVKKLLFELVLLREDDIMEDYDNSIGDSEVYDEKIWKWIEQLLEQKQNEK